MIRQPLSPRCLPSPLVSLDICVHEMRRVLLVACIALLGAVGLFCSTSFSNAPDGLELIDSSRHNSTCASQSWLSAMRNTNTAQFKNPDYSIKCPVLTGGQRILELHAGYWDVVALVSFTGPLHATGQLAQDAQRVILCAAPLVVNEWGIPPSTPCSNKEWFSWTDGCTSNCIHRPNNLEARVPHWQRLAEPAHQRSIRVHNVQVCLGSVLHARVSVSSRGGHGSLVGVVIVTISCRTCHPW
jgi:hypothetical protein